MSSPASTWCFRCSAASREHHGSVSGRPFVRLRVSEIRVLHGDGLLLPLIFAGQKKFHVHRIGMAQRNGRLHPLELHLPRDAERIGSGLELPEILHAKYLNL